MKTIAALLFSAVALSPLAHAENSWYGVVSMGQSKYDADKGDANSSLGANGLTVTSSKLSDTDTGLKVQAGYLFTPNFALEGGLVDLGRLNYKVGVTDGSINADAKLTIHAYGLNADAVGILPLGAGFSLFAKAGVIVARVESDVSASSNGFSASDDGAKTSLRPTFGAGAAYALNERLSFRLEFERFSKLKSDDAGEGNVDLASIGLVAKF